MTRTIRYRSGYKYQLVDSYSLNVGIYPDESISTEFIDLDKDGVLKIKRGYAWDGASGGAIDTKSIMRGALVHDALYQLMRQGKLLKAYRAAVDWVMKHICLKDGMFRIRAWWVHIGVRLGGGPSASPDARKKVHTAP